MKIASVWERRSPSFGFVSTRFAGTDGVSLETAKWVDVINSNDCQCFFLAGQLDTPPERSHLAPKAFFQHPEILDVQSELFANKRRTPVIGQRITALKEELKAELKAFADRFHFEILVVQNALAIPVNIPLGLALSEFIIESGIPTIGHHHDFYWERQRFSSAAAVDYLRQAFPPIHPGIQHVVINTTAGNELARRTGANWTLVPNVLDFKQQPAGVDDYTRDFRKEIGLDDDCLLVLQPTRVVSRKGIETAIEIVKRIDHPKSSLVITHEAGDEGEAYQKRVLEYADFLGVDLRIISDRIGDKRKIGKDGRKVYTLWDAYPHADLVTYPSTYEGYGNAFVEAVYFRKPVVVNRYSVFEADIEPKGFDVITFDTFITDATLQGIRQVLEDPRRRERMVEANYMLGWRYLSYEMLEEKLEQLLTNHYGS